MMKALERSIEATPKSSRKEKAAVQEVIHVVAEELVAKKLKCKDVNPVIPKLSLGEKDE